MTALALDALKPMPRSAVGYLSSPSVTVRRAAVVPKVEGLSVPSAHSPSPLPSATLLLAQAQAVRPPGPIVVPKSEVSDYEINGTVRRELTSLGIDLTGIRYRCSGGAVEVVGKLKFHEPKPPSDAIKFITLLEDQIGKIRGGEPGPRCKSNLASIT